MGLRLIGYGDLTLLRASSHARVYAGVREADARPVIAKVFDLSPDEAEIEARVEHEFSLLDALQVEGVIRPLALERLGDQLVLLLERAPGVDLASFAMGQAIAIDRFADIAVQIAEILARVHARRIIHRDIKPTNIVIEPETGVVHLADFGISVLLERERRHVYDPDVIGGTLPYVSPEQTGRTNRPVDFRSDLYSLGVTFYELLTGRRPFVYDDPLELIHAHLARNPEPPRTLRPELPAGFARVVTKLLGKAPEHRYQTASGLAADLRALRERFANGDAGEDFELGREDIPRELRLPHELHGRARERAQLRDALDEVVRLQQPRLVVLAGRPGIGKSALVRDFDGEIARVGSDLAQGRFEADQARPYSAFVDAFRGLVEQLLTQSDALLARWRGRLELALGGIAGVIVELVPTLAAVLGEVGAPEPLDPRATRNRVQLAVARFLSVFCDERRPLVLVLEDLQWADESSVALLESLFEGGGRGPMLVLTTVREHGLADSHPFAAALARMGEVQVVVERIGPLSQDAVESLLVATLGRSRVEVEGLARQISRRTDNNPLFIRQLLEHLVSHQLLRATARGWVWDEVELERASVPENVLEVMRAKLAGLRPELAELMQQAACIGERFELSTLDLISARPLAEIVAALHELIGLGLIDRSLDGYRFVHGIREAALAGAGPRLQRRLRWTIGQQLLAAGPVQTTAELFEIVEHLEAGFDEGGGQLGSSERVELSRLYARAGSRALASAAHDVALVYHERGIELLQHRRASVLEQGSAAAEYESWVGLHHERAQVLALAGRREAAAAAYTELLDWPLDDADRGRIAAGWITQLNLTGARAEAVAYGLELMARFGCPVAASPSLADARELFDRARASVRALGHDALLGLPTCVDGRAGAVMDVLEPTRSASYMLDRQLYLVLIATHVLWFLRHGVHPSVPLAVAQLGNSVGGFQAVEEALGLSELALELADRLADGPARIRTACAVQLFIVHLGRPFAEPLDATRELYPRALEAGDYLWAGYAGAQSLSMHLEVGTHLRVLHRHCEQAQRELGTRASGEARVVAANLEALATLLVGVGGDADKPDAPSDASARASLDPELVAARGGSRYSVCVTTANLALVELLLGNHERALQLCLGIIDEVEQVLFASWVIPRVALTLLVAADKHVEHGHDDEPSRDLLARAASRAHDIIARWAAGSRANYGHYLDLAEGLRGRDHRALAQIESARAAAASCGCRWVEGLAAEQLGDRAARDGLPGFAAGARQQAMAAYEAWGAKAKLEQMRIAHGELVERRAGASGSAPTTSTPSSSANALDFDTVLRSVAKIAADLRLDEVIASVLEASMTIAGADHGALVLERGGILGIVAEVDLDADPQVLTPTVPLRESGARAPSSLIHFVLRTGQALVIDEVREDNRFRDDPYLVAAGVRSLLGVPIILAERTLGVLVLENRLSAACFTSERLEALHLIVGQAARALDRARIHGALRESEARWRSLVDGVPDLIALIGPSGELEFVNRQLDADSPDHAQILQRFDSVPRTPSWRETIEAVLAGGDMRELELELVEPGAASLWYVARVAPIVVGDGHRELDDDELERSRMAIIIATDISARKQAEAEAVRLETQLRQQQRLESLGTLASGVAHEINNPIQGIMNYAELIESNLGHAELVREFAGEIRVESERVATIVRSLLAFSRRERALPAEDMHLREIVRTTLALAQTVMRREALELAVSIPEDLPPIHCRPQQIQQILMNLLTNARDAINSGELGHERRIEIHASARALDDGRPGVRVTVADSGPGIPADVLPHIFDPFFTTKGRDQGTGLGLAVSHGIAQDHGGELSVESEPGHGARFHLDLPLLA